MATSWPVRRTTRSPLPSSWLPLSTSRCQTSDQARSNRCRFRGVGSPNEHQPHAKYTEGSRRRSVHSKVKANRTAVQGACGARFSRLPDARRSWRSARRKAKRELSARRQIEGKHGALEVDQNDEVTHAIIRSSVAIGGKADLSRTTSEDLVTLRSLSLIHI